MKISKPAIAALIIAATAYGAGVYTGRSANGGCKNGSLNEKTDVKLDDFEAQTRKTQTACPKQTPAKINCIAKEHLGASTDRILKRLESLSGVAKLGAKFECVRYDDVQRRVLEEFKLGQHRLECPDQDDLDDIEWEGQLDN